MTAYVIVLRETPVTDPAAIEEYTRLAPSKEPTPGLKVLAAYGALTGLEGREPDAAVIIEFPTVEAAEAWYNTPNYQAAVAARRRAADFRVMIVEGLPSASS